MGKKFSANAIFNLVKSQQKRDKVYKKNLEQQKQ